jgi:hypothetical protein
LARSGQGLLASLLISFVAGCHYYWVPERALDSVAGLPRGARKHTALPAERVSDGKATFIHASDARPMAQRAGAGRRVRVLRPLLIPGLVLLIEGAAIMAGGIGGAYATGSGPCPNDGCAAPAVGLAITLGTVGGLEFATIAGALPHEVRAGAPGFTYVTP